MQKLNLGEGYNDFSAETSSDAPQSTPRVNTSTQTSSPTSADSASIQKGSSMSRGKRPMALMVAVIAIGGGILTGMGAYKLQAKSGGNFSATKAPISQVAGDNAQAGEVFGVQDEKTFKDSAEGYLEIGGINGEGSHKLLRPGGETQTVYLTSSVTDLSKFDGM